MKNVETKEPVTKTETSEGDGDGEVTSPNEVPLVERMVKLESMLALVLEGQLENQAKQVKTSGEIPDHIGETRQSYKAESQGESTLDGTLTNGREMLGINVTPVADFLQNPRKPKIEFSTWFESFKTYLVASGISGVNKQRKAYLLRNCLGTKELGSWKHPQIQKRRCRK